MADYIYVDNSNRFAMVGFDPSPPLLLRACMCDD
jgi:hypothetical protein